MRPIWCEHEVVGFLWLDGLFDFLDSTSSRSTYCVGQDDTDGPYHGGIPIVHKDNLTCPFALCPFSFSQTFLEEK